MACCEVKSLIKLLQNCGDNVISGQTKLTVTSEILKEINEITLSIKEDIYASPLTNTDLINKYSSNNELMFLYDFIKKTPKLRISNTMSSQNLTVSISDFTSLKYLELYKFNVRNVGGIQFLRENLEIVVCVRCLDKVSDLFLSSDAGVCFSSIWNKLRHAVLSRNNLVSLDESFIHTPWLQYLDLSYNKLDDIRQLTCLRNLTHLNVSYNRLTEVPKFAMYKLKVLILNNNYITNITGLSSLEVLQECNLSDNCLAEHATLFPLAELANLQSLNILRNPLAYHPMHRSLTCGYLHENVVNKHFLLDGQPVTSAESEFIRYCSRGSANTSTVGRNGNISSIFNPESSEIYQQMESKIVKKLPKKPREAIIADSSIVSDDLNNFEITEKSVTIDRNEGDEEHIQLKKEIEKIRKEQGPHWLISKSATKVGNLIGIADLNEEILDTATFQNDENYLFEKETNETSLAEKSSENLVPTVANNDGAAVTEKNSNNITEIKVSTDESKEEENFDTEESEKRSCIGELKIPNDEEKTSDKQVNDIIDFSEESLWLVERVRDDNSKDALFLILNDGELKEVDPVKQSVITRWSIDCIERYIKISNEPFTVKLEFDVMKRDNRQRTFVMEYADAKVLMKRVDTEVENRRFNQILLRCMKCDSLFCQELPKRKTDGEEYACTSCYSTAVLEEDVSVLESGKVSNTNDTSTPLKNESKSSDVTQSPSMSSIGSAASLDQNTDCPSNDASHTSHQESDIEVMSNPSESSIEILAGEPNRPNESKTVLQRLSERLSISEISTSDLPSVSAALNELLTESSSSGSMTDSSCTTIGSNYLDLTRGPHRISQSTVDETLLEESSSVETSPQQRCSEERFTSSSDLLGTSAPDKKYKNDMIIRSERTGTALSSYVPFLEGVLQSVSLGLMTPSRRDDQDEILSSPFEYSYTDFSCVDHRIKLYFWDQVTPNNEEISAFIRVNAIVKSGSIGPQFPGLVFLTSKKIYLVKITNKEIDENPSTWLQKYESVMVEKIKLIKPVLWKQGFCVYTEDHLPNGENIRYLMLLYDEKRTENFLSFVKDQGIVHVQMFEDTSETRDSIDVSEINEDVRNLTITDAIVIRHDDGEDEVHNFVAFVVTSEEILILKLDIAWLLSNEMRRPFILCRERITDLVNYEETKNGISLLFENESERNEKSWYVDTVSYDSKTSIINAIREPWEKYFDVQLPTSQTVNL